MTAQTRTVLKALFEDGDTPDGSTFADLLDSFVSIADTTAQTTSSDLVVPTLTATTEVSSPVISTKKIIGTPSATSMAVGVLTVTDLTVTDSFNLENAREYGELYIDATAAVSASAAYVKVVSTATALSTYLSDFTVTAGTLIYNGSTTKVFNVGGHVTVAASGAATPTFLAIGVNSSAHTRTEIRKNVGTANDILSTRGLVNLATGDKVGLMLKGTNAAAAGWAIKKMIVTVWS